MDVSNRAIEHAEAMVALERDTVVGRIRQDIAKAGTLHCIACGDEIAAERRAAMPSACRCMDCEERHELAARRGW